MSNYDVFVKDYREKYGMFRVKSFDWDQITAAYRTELEANQTDAALHRILLALLDSLNDGHTFLFDPTQTYPFYLGGEIGRRNRAEYEDFEFSDVTANYVDIIDSAG
ncbi:MAG: hypothetical protein AAFV07_12345, partial [Bacteroidota bacterium]